MTATKTRKKGKRTRTSNEVPITGQKKKLWVVFSRYIRMRDCVEATGTITHGKCCTCGRSYPIGKLQAGHFIPGRADSILFAVTCVHTQCYRCNVIRSGEWVKYFRYMEGTYGLEHIFQLMKQSEAPCEITPEWIASSMTYYQEQVEAMEAMYGQ